LPEILHRQPQFVTRLTAAEFFFVERRMMLKNNFFAQYAPEDRRRLVNHRCEGDRVYDALQAVAARVIKREGQRRQRLAAAGRHVEGKRAARLGGAGANMREDFAPQLVDLCVAGTGAEIGETAVEAIDQVFDDLGKFRPVAIFWNILRLCVKILRVAKIAIDETGKKHATEDAVLKQLSVLGLPPTELRRLQQSGLGTDVFAPDGVQRFQRLFQALQAVVEITDAVRQTSMMPRDAMSDDMRHETGFGA
jgi:hypothetical protein